MSEHPLFCFTHRQFGCVHDKMQDDCEFVTANGLCDRIDTLTAELVQGGEWFRSLRAERDTLTAENAELKAANGSEHPVEGMKWCLTHDRLHTGVTWTDERFVDRADYAKWCNPSCRVVPVFFHKEDETP